MANILIVDDDKRITDFLCDQLKLRGHACRFENRGEQLLEKVNMRDVDLLILDVMLPDVSGFEVCRRIRANTDYYTLPILFLSSMDSQEEINHGLAQGADDYVTKPFGIDELLARVRASVRRSTPPPDEVPVVTTDHLVIDLAARRLSRDGHDVRLTPTEWHLVELLVRNSGKLVTQRQLLQEVWGPEFATETNYLRVYFARIRRKLEVDPAAPAHFITEPGMGYRFEP